MRTEEKLSPRGCDEHPEHHPPPLPKTPSYKTVQPGKPSMARRPLEHSGSAFALFTLHCLDAKCVICGRCRQNRTPSRVRMPVGPLWLALDFALGLWCARLAKKQDVGVRCPTGLERRPEPWSYAPPVVLGGFGCPLSLLLSR